MYFHIFPKEVFYFSGARNNECLLIVKELIGRVSLDLLTRAVDKETRSIRLL